MIISLLIVVYLLGSFTAYGTSYALLYNIDLYYIETVRPRSQHDQKFYLIAALFSWVGVFASLATHQSRPIFNPYKNKQFKWFVLSNRKLINQFDQSQNN